MSDGVRTIRDAETVLRNAGYTGFAFAADLHAEWRCGEATVFVRDDLCGSISILVRSPRWADDARLPAGVPPQVLHYLVVAAKSAAEVGAS